MRFFVFALFSSALFACQATRSAAPAGFDAKAQFERIKALAGSWGGKGGEGDQTFDAEIQYRVTAGGSAVEETMAPGSPHEMITMYHLDNDRLLLTHYCAAGNQPQMMAGPGATPDEIAFSFLGATNLKNPNDGHMHAARFRFLGKDKLETIWTYFQDGKAAENASFKLERKK